MVYTTATSHISASTVTYPTPGTYTNFAISTDPTKIGTALWYQTYSWPSGNVTIGASYNCMGNGVFTMFQKETRLWMGFSETTGAQLWTSTTPEIDNHIYDINSGGVAATSFINNGILFASDRDGSGGNLYAYNATTGVLIFDYQTGTMGYNGVWAYTPCSVGAIAAGNIFWYSNEHSPSASLEPGFMIGDINGTTGTSIWNYTFWAGSSSQPFVVADGYLVSLNNYDNQIYAFGKGPTATTIQTPLIGITQGQDFIVQGTVMDTSAGTKQTTVATRFPNGVPAVSDNSQTAWMQYVYMQNPKPTSTSGVDVSISLVDPNGNINIVGTTHSDSNGLYTFHITSRMLTAGAGTYAVLANFAGSGSYWPSNSESAFILNSAQAVTPTTTPQSNLATTTDIMTYIAVAAIAIIIAIAIIGALILVSLRKRP